MTSVEVNYDVYLEWRNLSQKHADMVDTRVEAFKASTFGGLEAASSAGVEGLQELVPGGWSPRVTSKIRRVGSTAELRQENGAGLWLSLIHI